MTRCVLLVLALTPAGCDPVFDLTGQTIDVPPVLPDAGGEGGVDPTGGSNGSRAPGLY